MLRDHRVYRADSLLMATAIIWGTGFVAQRVGMDYVGPLTFTTLAPLLLMGCALPWELWFCSP